MYSYILRRTGIYTPGNNPYMIFNSAIFGADTIVLDLEDGVSVNEKDAARILVRNALTYVDFRQSEVAVRINSLSTPYGMKDLMSVVCERLDAIRLPKCEHSEDVIKVSKILDKLELERGLTKGRIKIMPIIESALGAHNSVEIACSDKRICALNFGGEDYTADIGAERTREGEELFDIRMKVLTAASIAGINALDTVFGDINDIEGLTAETRLVKKLGFDGKSVIHPRQIKIIHKVFTPSEKEIKKAMRIINALEEAEKKRSGVIALGGKMIDAPVAARAKKVLLLAKAAGLV